MQYRKLTKAEAAQFATSIDELSDSEFSKQVEAWESHQIEEIPSSYKQLRKSIVKAFDDARPAGLYSVDLAVGFKLYALLQTEQGFDNVTANDDDVWRYLSCKVFPDLTYLRYPKPEKEVREKGGRINRKRFYSHTRRIWLKTLWWYIHLAWQGSEEETYKVLRGLGSDAISDFVERTGKGYRLPLYREMIKGYSSIARKSSDLFNKINQRNLVDCRTIEPALTKDGERGYVRDLIAQFVDESDVQK